MPTDIKNDPILARFRTALDEIYGDELDRVVLYGSRARGDGHNESDYDVAVFLKSFSSLWKELNRLVDLKIEFVEDTGAFFDAKPFPMTAYAERTPIMHEIRRDGLDI